MDAAFVVVRAVHFAACMWLVGELAFASFVVPDAPRLVPSMASVLDRRLQKVVLYACAAAAISAVAWLVVEAADMAGTSLGAVLPAGTVQVVLRDTSFGHVFVLRGAAFAALAVSLAAWAAVRTGRAHALCARVALAVAMLELVTLALVGHAAAAGEGVVGSMHVTADALHLAAAGAWLGALPPLVHCLARPLPIAALARIARRFSVLGACAVVVLVASGIVNTLFLVGSVPALVGTPYGRTLLAKLAVFVAMLALAAANRLRWTPRIVASDAAAVHFLRRNAMLEICGGIVIVGIVGALGTMIPGAHQSPRWPFPYTLDGSPDIAGGGAAIALASGIVAIVGIALIIAGMRRGALRSTVPGVLAIALALLASTSLFAVPAYPTTYATSPVAYTVAAVARGGDDYAANCSRCHGPRGHGDGPDAAALPVRPKNLVEHVPHHPPGSLFWWIAHGIAGTPMPAFLPALSETRIWQLVQFLVARANADSAASLGPRLDARSAIRVPDFAYENDGGDQQTLRGQTAPALVVLYSLPGSAARLAALAGDHRLMHTALRVVTVPRETGAAREGSTRADPDVARVYGMFAAQRDGAPAPHAELLIDGSGVLRARWLGVPGPDSDRDAQLLDALRHLPAAAAKEETTHHHGH